MSLSYSEKELIDFSYQILHIKFESLSDEAVYRSVINRSYYGAFLRARNKAGIKKQSPSIHGDVIRYYESNGSHNISNGLMNLRRSRETADYETHKKVSVQDAKSSLKIAKKIIDALE